MNAQQTDGTILDLASSAGAASPVAPLTRRTRKRNERRDLVFTTAITLFVQRGFDETSMDDIAAQCGLARTTVFNHFPRKVMLLTEWTLRRRMSAAKSFANADLTGRPVRDLLGGYLAALATINCETRTETTAIMPPTLKNTDALVDHPLARDLAALISETGAALRPSASPALVGRLLSLGYFSAVMRWIDTESAPFDLNAELSALLDTVLDGALQEAPAGTANGGG